MGRQLRAAGAAQVSSSSKVVRGEASRAAWVVRLTSLLTTPLLTYLLTTFPPRPSTRRREGTKPSPRCRAPPPRRSARSPHSTRPPPPLPPLPPPAPPQARAAAAAAAREAGARGAEGRAAPPARVLAPLRRPGTRPPRLAARQLAAARHARRSAKALRGRCRGRARRPRCRDLPQPVVVSRGRQPRQSQMGGQKGGQRGGRARGSGAPRQRCTTTTYPQPLRTPEWVA